MKTYYLALDLKDDPALIAEYEVHHRNVWPEITAGIIEAGIKKMEIYRTGNRLVMVMQTDDDFDFSKKAELDANNEKLQQWETLMWKYQKSLPHAKPGEKWILMENIFTLG